MSKSGYVLGAWNKRLHNLLPEQDLCYVLYSRLLRSLGQEKLQHKGMEETPRSSKWSRQHQCAAHSNSYNLAISDSKFDLGSSRLAPLFYWLFSGGSICRLIDVNCCLEMITLIPRGFLFIHQQQASQDALVPNTLQPLFINGGINLHLEQRLSSLSVWLKALVNIFESIYLTKRISVVSRYLNL